LIFYRATLISGVKKSSEIFFGEKHARNSAWKWSEQFALAIFLRWRLKYIRYFKAIQAGWLVFGSINADAFSQSGIDRPRGWFSQFQFFGA